MGRSLTLSRRDIARWDVKGARGTAFRLAHPHMRPLREVVSEATELVRPSEEPERLWPIYGVSNRRGVILNELRSGSQFKAPQKRIEKDWFFHNPTRANVGSLGRVGDVEPDALTSPEYQVWKIDRDLLPDFMELVLKLGFFREQVEFNRVGSVKERLFVENLRDIVVPVPSAKVQARYVARYAKADGEAEARTREALAIRAGIDGTLLARLGLHDLEAPARGKATVVRRGNAERWGVAFNQMVNIAAALENGHFPVQSLSGLSVELQYGSSAKSDAEDDAGIPILRMGNLVDGELDVEDLKYVVLSDREAASLILRDGDILINRTNSKELVGKCAVFHAPGTYVFASYLIRARCPPNIVDPDYLALVLNSPVGRRQIDRLSRQALGMANINSDEIRALHVPIPPIDLQRNFAAEAAALRRQVSEMLNAAQQLRAKALNAIEQDLLSGE